MRQIMTRASWARPRRGWTQCDFRWRAGGKRPGSVGVQQRPLTILTRLAEPGKTFHPQLFPQTFSPKTQGACFDVSFIIVWPTRLKFDGGFGLREWKLFHVTRVFFKKCLTGTHKPYIDTTGLSVRKFRCARHVWTPYGHAFIIVLVSFYSRGDIFQFF